MSKKKLTITYELPSQKVYDHLVDGYGVICKYREAQGKPHMNMATWVTSVLINAVNHVFEAERKAIEAKEQSLGEEDAANE